MKTKKCDIELVGQLRYNLESPDQMDGALSTMVFDLCGITHVTGVPHPGCAGCGECMANGTIMLLLREADACV